MLFVPPGAGWSFTYRYHIQHLRDDFRCIALDLPGYGLSEAAEGYGFTLLEQSHVLERFVEALDLRNIVAGATMPAVQLPCSPWLNTQIAWSV
jgi:haloalkane dehalogenase